MSVDSTDTYPEGGLIVRRSVTDRSLAASSTMSPTPNANSSLLAVAVHPSFRLSRHHRSRPLDTARLSSASFPYSEPRPPV